MRNLVLFLFSLSLTFDATAQKKQPQLNDRAIKFDGKNDRIDFGDVYRDLNVPFTVSAWAYLDTDNLFHCPIFTNRNCIPLYSGFRLIVDKNYISIEYGDGVGGKHHAYRRGKEAIVSLKPGSWNYIAAVVHGPEKIDLYFNGVDVGGDFTGTSMHPMDSSNPNGFASAGYFVSNDVEVWFKGMIDEIRLWNRALGQAEIKKGMCDRLTGKESGLIGYWDFNEMSGNVALDKSPKKIHGKFFGKPVRVSSTLPCATATAGGSKKPVDAEVTNGEEK